MNNQNNNHTETKHSYDGIEENNHPMPSWWVWSFIITIIFAFHYYMHFELTRQAPTLTEELEISMQQLKELQKQAANKFPVLTEDQLEEKLKDPNLVKMGANIFQSKCAMCHGENMQGKIGPNLTDKTWIHGGKSSEILLTVRQGVSSKGMPPWEGQLNTEEIFGVVALIKSKGL